MHLNAVKLLSTVSEGTAGGRKIKKQGKVIVMGKH
jgi:hypothetical protein